MSGTEGESLVLSLLEESNVGADSIPRDQSGSVAGLPVALPMPSRVPITTVMHEPEDGVALHALPRTASSASVPGSVAGPPVALPMPPRVPMATVMHEPEGGVALHALPRTASSASVPGSVAGSTGAASVAGSTRRRVIKPVSMFHAALLLLSCDNLPPARSAMRAHMYRRRAFYHLRLRRA
jgi:hypothetical protein